MEANLSLAVFIFVMFFGVVYGYYTTKGSGIYEHPYRNDHGGAPGAHGRASVYGRDERQDMGAWSRGTR